jgi:hypothetical protein
VCVCVCVCVCQNVQWSPMLQHKTCPQPPPSPCTHVHVPQALAHMSTSPKNPSLLLTPNPQSGEFERPLVEEGSDKCRSQELPPATSSSSAARGTRRARYAVRLPVCVCVRVCVFVCLCVCARYASQRLPVPSSALIPQPNRQSWTLGREAQT